LYGISQIPNTNDYILIFNWTSGSENIDDFIQERQMESNDVIFEWIPYSQLNQIKETGKNDLITLYSAVWDGPLQYKECNNHIRDSNKEVALKYLHNSQNHIEFVINEV
jgi:hypothetical protein